MTPTLAVLTALTHKGGVTSEGRVVGAIFFAVVGIAAVVIGWLGWRHAGQIVPSSLPDDLFDKRCRVVRRGSVAFAIVGAVFIVVAAWVVATS